MIILNNDSLAFLKLYFRIFNQKHIFLSSQVRPLLGVFFGRVIWDKIAGPDLAVRMRIGASHDFSLVFKNLHPTIRTPKLCSLFGPYVDDGPDRLQRHFRKRQIMSWRKADYPAFSGHTLPAKEALLA